MDEGCRYHHSVGVCLCVPSVWYMFLIIDVPSLMCLSPLISLDLRLVNLFTIVVHTFLCHIQFIYMIGVLQL